MQIVTFINSATDSEAVIELYANAPELPAGLSGSLIGPTCAYSRTLPNEAVVETRSDAAQRSARAQILLTEPCYWTPALPFLYTLHLNWPGGAIAPHQLQALCGFRRLVAHGQSLFWDSRRFVLRGVVIDSFQKAMIDEVRAAEVTIIAPNPSDEQCDLADRWGVALIADLRETDSELDADHLQHLSTRASVVAILVDSHQVMPCELHRIAPQALLAVAVYPDDAPKFSTLSVPDWCRVVVVELEEKPLPANAPQQWRRPVIAIRRGVSYGDFHEARAACDRLQADLAPEFNLAGYFVASD